MCNKKLKQLYRFIVSRYDFFKFPVQLVILFRHWNWINITNTLRHYIT